MEDFLLVDSDSDDGEKRSERMEDGLTEKTKGKSGHSSREKEKPKREGNRFILSLDVGTTGVRAIIFDDHAELVGSSYQPLVTLYPQPGWVEQEPGVSVSFILYLTIPPQALWEQSVLVVKDALKDARLDPEQIAAMGITTQRSSFCLWNR